MKDVRGLVRHGSWSWLALEAFNRLGEGLGGLERKAPINREDRSSVLIVRRRSEVFGGFRGLAKANRKPTTALGAARGFRRLVIGLGRGSETCKEAVVGVVGSAVVEVAVCCRSYVN